MIAGMDPLLAARQASHAAASSSQSNSQYPDFNSSLPVYSGLNAGYTQSTHIPPDFEHILNRAHEHYRGGDYHQALQLCQSVRQEVFKTQSSYLAGFVNYYRIALAVPWNQDKDKGRICAVVLQIYIQSQSQTGLLLLIGAIYYQLGNFEQCIAFNDRCIILEPQMAEAHANLANALQQLGNFDMSIIYYQVTIQKLKHSTARMTLRHTWQVLTDSYSF